eukprot:CAMPEP_0114633626 /NCGR_PEP_ID=MMETSP0168-20121206/15550_1 /TAXON_ID=95228 ORGANISM="Vannella sp., Strain DIVA3 517/6/12" /NCGR_SAMPLE_ID=MMETSP0168 /ASSEMBLY_ACC=CAM_ASM_000044 /LENGTH=157 /DNA_ID=CAMNT_0001845279 /DNA_START=21 /DNA_END=491 /DNA_ORIENTATION=+
MRLAVGPVHDLLEVPAAACLLLGAGHVIWHPLHVERGDAVLDNGGKRHGRVRLEQKLHEAVQNVAGELLRARLADDGDGTEERRVECYRTGGRAGGLQLHRGLSGKQLEGHLRLTAKKATGAEKRRNGSLAADGRAMIAVLALATRLPFLTYLRGEG